MKRFAHCAGLSLPLLLSVMACGTSEHDFADTNLPDASVGDVNQDITQTDSATSDASQCIPKTCASFNADCGEVNDGCNATLKCGSCLEGMQCGGDGPNKCGSSVCAPKSCAALGASCGNISDGCAATLNCGTCSKGLTCGANNQCEGQDAGDGSVDADAKADAEAGCSPGETCSDGNACTIGDYCNSSALCVGGSALSCNTPPSDCREAVGSCDQSSGCAYAVKPVASACTSDNNPCTTDQCSDSGTCLHSPAPNGTACTGGVCVNGSCALGGCTPGQSCNDGHACTTSDYCNSAAQCVGGSTISCNTSPGECYQSSGSCDDGTGACSYPGKAAGTPCSTDNNPCTVDQCSGNGLCSHGNAPNGTVCPGGKCSSGACVAECPAATITFGWGTVGSGSCHIDLAAGGSSTWYYTKTTDAYLGGFTATCTASGTWDIQNTKCVPRGSSTTCFVTGTKCDGSGPASFPYPHCWTCCNATDPVPGTCK